MTILVDLGIQCDSAELCLDNTTAIAFVNGSGSQRTRHLKVRGYKIRQLIQSGWTISHCPGEYRKADLLTKALQSVRLQFLCSLLQLGGDTATTATSRPEVRTVGVVSSALLKVLMLLQISRCCSESTDDGVDEGGVPIEWPWELAVVTVLVVLSTLFLWETAGAPCRRRQSEEPQIRAVSVEKERRARKLQGRVSAAIEAALSESPTGDEALPRVRKDRTKCSGSSAQHRSESTTPTVVYGGINMHIPPASVPAEANLPRNQGLLKRTLRSIAVFTKAKATKAPVVLNGTYGSVGPMTLDDEVRQASSVLTGRDEAAGSEAGRTGQGSGVSSLRIAAGRVMATVAAKVQEVIPPAGKSGSTTSVLVQEDNGSAGTVGSGYVTAGSEPRRESRLNEDQEQADRNLFSPQQARRLQEMETEAPLLYAGDEGEEADAIDLEEVDDKAFGLRRINLVRASLHLDTQPTPAKVGEYYEHLLTELEAVSRVSEAQSGTVSTPKPEGNKGVRQIEAKTQSASEVASPQREPKGPKSGGASGGESPKKLCKWFHEGKGCRRGKECRFAHDWNQVPKPDRVDRCMACGGKGHRKDACPNVTGGAVAKRDDGASSAKAAKSEGQPKTKGQDPGLKKVLSEAAGVLREVLATHPSSSESTSVTAQDQPHGGDQGVTSAKSGTKHLEGPLTWATVQTAEGTSVRLRGIEYPWGEPGIKPSLQAKVNDDTLLGVMPMWLWTLSSIAKGEDVPFCQTCVLQGDAASSPWLQQVVTPFATWSNSSEFAVQGVNEGVRQTKPFHVCTNLGFSNSGAKTLRGSVKPEGVPWDSAWPVCFKDELSLALFGLADSRPVEEEPTAVKVVGAEESYLLDDPTRPSGPVSFRPPAPEVQAVAEDHSKFSKENELCDSPLDHPDASDSGGAEVVPESNEQAQSVSPKTREGAKARRTGAASRMTEAEREKWRKHIAAHHIPFRKDCLQCVMSGGLGLQHRRVKCPTMYAWAFDLAGPFKELGRDDRGGKYKYVLVAGLRVPDAALPSPRQGKGDPKAEKQAPDVQVEASRTNVPDDDDDAASEVSWLRDQLSPEPAVMKVDEDGDSSQEEDAQSDVSRYEAPFVEDLPPPEAEEAIAADDEPEAKGGTGLDVDPWEDSGGYADMTDEKFDEALSELLFSGANKVLRFAVPLKARQGPLILAGLQEVVTECNRLGYPVKVVHTDRAKELMSKATMDWLQSNLIQPSFTQGDDPKSNGLAERLVGWVKARARLHLASSGLGVEQWPSAMAFACAEHRRRLLQQDGTLPRFGQKVIFKSKHPTGKSKRPFLRWEHAVYLCPTPRTEGGHVLLRGASGAYLVAKNVRCVEDMVDPEAEFGKEEVVEVDPPEPGFDHYQGRSPTAPSRRVRGKRAVRSVQLASEAFAESLLLEQLFTSDHCGRLLQLAFGGVEGGTRREHRGQVGFSVIFGAYSHGGLHGITRASRMYPMVSRYLNEYLRRCSSNENAENEWASLMVVVADEVAMHRDVRNEPGSLNHVTQLTTRMMWVEGDSPLMAECERKDAQGRTHQGYLLPLTQATTVFDPKRRHAVLPATNWVIAGYTPLGYQKLSTFKQHQLIELGFRLPSLDRTPTVCKLVGPCPDRLPGFRARPYPPPPGRAAMFVRYARMTGEEWAELCQLEEEEFERRMDRWQRVLGGHDKDPNMNSLSASSPHHLFMQTVFRQRNWNRNPEVVVPGAGGEPRLLARVMDFADDGPTEESPFPDRMLMFLVHDVIRDVLEMVILRVEARRPPQETQVQEEVGPVLQPPGPPPPEVRAVKKANPPAARLSEEPVKLPIPLPNPAYIKVAPVQPARCDESDAAVCKAEAATTKDLEGLLGQLREPLSVTHTASQEEVRAHLERWRPAIEKELGSLKKQGVLVSHYGNEAQELIANPETSVISLKGVFTAKAPGGPEDGLFKRKCRLVGCGNQATHVDADSLYAAGAPAEVVRVALTEACNHQWSAFTTDIKSAFTQTPIPPYAARRYLLRPPRWLIDLGLAVPGEYFSLGMVLYGFKEAPAWWSDHRDSKLRGAKFQDCHLEQAKSDSSVTVAPRKVCISQPVRFLGMQLQGYEDRHFSLDQEAYVDELVRAYQLNDTHRSKIVCPKEILMRESEVIQPFDEQAIKAAQKVAGECLWLSQRTRIDIAFSTTVLCSKVSRDPHGAIEIGRRIIHYLHHTKDFKLHLKPVKGVAPLRVFTDASFAPLGQHSYGGHVVEVKGVPALWKASKQQLISLSSSEAELIQAVEGCMYA
ncbi:RE2, partial [Symbiodinium microadriaticum]